jgi:hypothetical protein
MCSHIISECLLGSNFGCNPSALEVSVGLSIPLTFPIVTVLWARNSASLAKSSGNVGFLFGAATGAAGAVEPGGVATGLKGLLGGCGICVLIYFS